jgi:hypothetical protein
MKYIPSWERKSQEIYEMAIAGWGDWKPKRDRKFIMPKFRRG